MISLTPDQREAVVRDGNMMLSACPGSGKTRVIVAKLLHVGDQVAGTPRSIGCITYTNAAVNEIEARVKRFGNEFLFERCEIATIHSFCLHFILRPYCWLEDKIPKKFKILSREMGDFETIVTAVEDSIGRPIMWRIFDDYASLRMNLDGEPAGSGFETGGVTEESAGLYWEAVLRAGYLDFSMILYFAWKILRDHPFVSEGIAAKFAWLLVDEFQDTTDLQIEILRLLQQYLRTNFFLVGDENQSINGFAGARPDLALDFANDIKAHQNAPLVANFRSGLQIVTTAQKLIARNPVMHSAGAALGYDVSVGYFHVSNSIIAMSDHFLPLIADKQVPLGKVAILAPWWQHLLPIARRLREMGVPAFGPGARPYRRSRLYAVLAEQLGACVESETLTYLPGVERAIFHLISEAEGLTRFDVFSYEGRLTSLSLVYEAKRLAMIYPGGQDWLVRSVDSCADILVRGKWIGNVTAAKLIHSVTEMVGDMERSNVDVKNIEISDLGLFANPDKAVKLMTLHNAKGREFDAVALVNVNEGQIPHFSARTQVEFDEARRLFYVGITRAQKYLMVFSDQSDWRNKPTRFIAEASLS
jgi:DNA helicase II / ATP-dependent DNA helicase PcrA